MDDPSIVIRTAYGDARVVLADRWIAISRDGDLLERDVWDVTWTQDGVDVVRQVRTYPEPDVHTLRAAVAAAVRGRRRADRPA